MDRVEVSGPTLAALAALFLGGVANKAHEPIRGLLFGTPATSEEQISRNDADRDHQVRGGGRILSLVKSRIGLKRDSKRG